ncbi:MAG: Thiosulfate sulfurtransferase, rhodanese [uncultured Truepera sp.]|uniref:Thiosulfate sulfurtransferase, rhodanese n=1 Tax=uncultured Truepera sp. TaxID=543023 RepID=A0A6J4VMW8_9DEIN|nr:MAG: Thiosulfate sulfurtransferase, rhodanese [uncultured Truepera sp.]
MSNLISARELGARLSAPELRVIDVRASLTDPQAGRRLYGAGHLPGAVFLSLEDDLSGRAQEHGGRHPLPDMFTFAETLRTHGVGDESEVVVYDDSGGMIAARLWWLLRYAGFGGARVLDGGFSAWTEAGLAVTQAVPTFDPVPLTLRLRPGMVASMAEVQAKLGDAGVTLIDARSPERYRGEVEPLDKKAGHIPGAINKPFIENLEHGHFKSPEALSARFAEAAGEVILYCGSGVSAAHNALALEEAGIRGVKLYVGSWSDWSSHDENPVATGDDT